MTLPPSQTSQDETEVELTQPVSIDLSMIDKTLSSDTTTNKSKDSNGSSVIFVADQSIKENILEFNQLKEKSQNESEINDLQDMSEVFEPNKSVTLKVKKSKWEKQSGKNIKTVPEEVKTDKEKSNLIESTGQKEKIFDDEDFQSPKKSLAKSAKELKNKKSKRKSMKNRLSGGKTIEFKERKKTNVNSSKLFDLSDEENAKETNSNLSKSAKRRKNSKKQPEKTEDTVSSASDNDSSDVDSDAIRREVLKKHNILSSDSLPKSRLYLNDRSTINTESSQDELYDALMNKNKRAIDPTSTSKEKEKSSKKTQSKPNKKDKESKKRNQSSSSSSSSSDSEDESGHADQIKKGRKDKKEKITQPTRDSSPSSSSESESVTISKKIDKKNDKHSTSKNKSSKRSAAVQSPTSPSSSSDSEDEVIDKTNKRKQKKTKNRKKVSSVNQKESDTVIPGKKVSTKTDKQTKKKQPEKLDSNNNKRKLSKESSSSDSDSSDSEPPPKITKRKSASSFPLLGKSFPKTGDTISTITTESSGDEFYDKLDKTKDQNAIEDAELLNMMV